MTGNGTCLFLPNDEVSSLKVGGPAAILNLALLSSQLAEVAGLVKLCLAYEHGLIPGNLHYTEPNPNCLSLKDGTFKVISSIF